MLKRETNGYSRHIFRLARIFKAKRRSAIIVLAIASYLLLPGRPAFAQQPSTVPNGNTPTAKPKCLVKYSTLSALMCDTAATEEVTKTLAQVQELSPTPEVKKKTEEKSPIREMKGIKKEYLYTDRVTKDKTGWYTKMRVKTDEDSKRLEILRPGDKVRILKEDKKDWYYVQIFKSHDTKLEGKEGWIERWLVDNENVPKEPTPTPTNTKKTQSADESSSSEATVASASTSGEGTVLFDMINNYRSDNGLPKFNVSERLCAIARERAPEIAAEVANGTIHSGFKARGLGYPAAVENAVGYGNVQANFNWWINSGLHRASILGPDLMYSCVECASGNCVQLFSPNP